MAWLGNKILALRAAQTVIPLSASNVAPSNGFLQVCGNESLAVQLSADGGTTWTNSDSTPYPYMDGAVLMLLAGWAARIANASAGTDYQATWAFRPAGEPS